MQPNNIIEKARKLGLDIGNGTTSSANLMHIASQVGAEDLDSLNDILDDMLTFQNDDDYIEVLDDNFIEDDEQIVRERFGEKEYNAAKNEHGVYDKNYYANREKELDEKVEKAKDAKKEDQKEVLKKNEQGEKVPVQKNKNIFDKTKDNFNLAKAQRDRLQNKINDAKAKAYNVMHPGEALKDAAKAKLKEQTVDKAKDAAKNVAKKAGKAAGEAAKKGAKKAAGAIAKFIAANPIVLVIVGIVLIFLLLIIVLLGGAATQSEMLGLYGYGYIEPKCTEITIEGGEYAGVYDIEEYIAGVTYGEFGTFIGNSWNEAAKAGAIAARSFVEANVDSSCTVESSESFQVYKTPSEAAIQIAYETRGLVLTEEGNFLSAQYDAFCTDSPQNDPVNYIVCQQSQKVPREWADSQGGIDASWKTGEKNGAHGNGMSAWGAAYLAEQGRTFEEILEYYYGDAVIMSIYQSFLVSNNWTQEISANITSSVSASIMRTPINEMLSKSQYDDLNEYIYQSVMDVGVGTRSAIVAAAVTPIKYFAEYHNVVIPYTLGGGHYMTINSRATGENIQKTTATYYGVDPDWGTIISHSYEGNFYDEYGPDCSSWVPWVYHNAGVSMGQRLAGDFENLGQRYEMDEGYIAKPGDILENSHHVAVVVGVDESAKQYYISHARGGNYGTVITPVKFNSDNYYIVDMTQYIESHINNTYETDYMNGVLEY